MKIECGILKIEAKQTPLMECAVCVLIFAIVVRILL